MDEHSKSALLRAWRTSGEVQAIARSAVALTSVNSIVALERSGQQLERVELVFSQLAGANANEQLQAIEGEMSELLARIGTPSISILGPSADRWSAPAAGDARARR